MEKTLFYHHGTVPGEDMAKATAKLGKVPSRNAEWFDGVEKGVGKVVVDDGAKTEAIRAAYKKAGVPVLTVKEFAEGKEVKVEVQAEKPFNPDADREPAPGKKQGATKEK